jgi:hypothetical protein
MSGRLQARDSLFGLLEEPVQLGDTIHRARDLFVAAHDRGVHAPER